MFIASEERTGESGSAAAASRGCLIEASARLCLRRRRRRWKIAENLRSLMVICYAYRDITRIAIGYRVVSELDVIDIRVLGDFVNPY